MTTQNEITHLKQQMQLREIADDGYYLSRQYQEDSRALYELQTLLKSASAPTPSPRTPDV